jgi:hypothetical protein
MKSSASSQKGDKEEISSESEHELSSDSEDDGKSTPAAIKAMLQNIKAQKKEEALFSSSSFTRRPSWMTSSSAKENEDISIKRGPK